MPAIALSVAAVLLVACGGKKEPQAVKAAKAQIARGFGHPERCTQLGNGDVRCRVIQFETEPAVMMCTTPHDRGVGVGCHDVAPTRAELALIRRHAPHAKSVIHVVSAGRWSIPRSAIATGNTGGGAAPPFNLPNAFTNRSRLHGKGPSIYLTINRWHYEDDLVTDTGNQSRVRRSHRSGKLLSDWQTGVNGGTYWDAFTRVLQIERSRYPSYFGGPRDPLSAFLQLRRWGRLKQVDSRHYVDRDVTWTVNSHGIPVRFYADYGKSRYDVRFLKLEQLPLTPELRRQLRIGKHPHSRVLHTRR